VEAVSYLLSLLGLDVLQLTFIDDALIHLVIQYAGGQLDNIGITNC
jgi:hypothetical protein